MGLFYLIEGALAGPECKSAYIHPIKARKIFQLSDQQIQGFARFAASKHRSDQLRSYNTRFCPEHHAQRIDPSDSIALGIYRDEHERKPDPRQRRCVLYPEDNPSLFDRIQNLAQ
ncbi:hypothetical protein EMCG_04189 [[Emmonsia] crescens]|uniref:Uncharacterized protein n=1 Tax=[Emmonsia] crescens TaxID=73230 RepID=A0A0G2HT25_9EURO|nr:hypothetical protein EMCG_04189 [Emmonsia crescens UAMH 3008]